MAQRVQAPGQRLRGGLFAPLKQIPAERLYEFGIQGKVFRKLLWAFLLILLYIGNNHLANLLVYKLNKTNKEVEVLRVEYNTTKFGYMYNSKQSEVAERMKPYHVEESTVTPRKVRIRKEVSE